MAASVRQAGPSQFSCETNCRRRPSCAAAQQPASSICVDELKSLNTGELTTNCQLHGPQPGLGSVDFWPGPIFAKRSHPPNAPTTVAQPAACPRKNEPKPRPAILRN